jgi:hypothetical protein
VLEEAELRGTRPISTQQILEAVEAFRNDDMTREDFIQALGQPGLLGEPWKA